MRVALPPLLSCSHLLLSAPSLHYFIFVMSPNRSLVPLCNIHLLVFVLHPHLPPYSLRLYATHTANVPVWRRAAVAYILIHLVLISGVVISTAPCRDLSAALHPQAPGYASPFLFSVHLLSLPRYKYPHLQFSCGPFPALSIDMQATFFSFFCLFPFIISRHLLHHIPASVFDQTFQPYHSHMTLCECFSSSIHPLLV